MDNYLLMAATAVGGIFLMLFAWSFISNAQFGLTLVAAKDAQGFLPFLGTFFLYTLGFYFIVLFVLVACGVIYVKTHPQPPAQISVPSS
jgi:hypothetical protein